jgi:hypothetical protein
MINFTRSEVDVLKENPPHSGIDGGAGMRGVNGQSDRGGDGICGQQGHARGKGGEK